MRIKLYLISCVLILTSVLNAQVKEKDISLTLKNLYDTILYTNIDAKKIKLNDSICLLIESYVNSDSVLKHNFTNLRYLGQIKSPDSKLKIINWNLVLRDGSNRYFCYFIRKGEKGNKNKIYKLFGSHSDKPIRTDRKYSDKEWYGALYYAIQPYQNDYIVLGLDNGGLLMTRKIIDVLSFPEGGGLIFGKSCFVNGKDTKWREILEYSSDGVISLRFKSSRFIVFDHLSAYSTGHADSNESYGAEGLTFDGYKLKKGNWEFVTNVNAKNVRKKR